MNRHRPIPKWVKCCMNNNYKNIDFYVAIILLVGFIAVIVITGRIS